MITDEKPGEIKESSDTKLLEPMKASLEKIKKLMKKIQSGK
jgi:hypothetical protein